MSSIQRVLLIIFFILLALSLKIDLNNSIRIRKRITSNFYPMELLEIKKKKRTFEINLLILMNVFYYLRMICKSNKICYSIRYS